MKFLLLDQLVEYFRKLQTKSLLDASVCELLNVHIKREYLGSLKRHATIMQDMLILM